MRFRSIVIATLAAALAALAAGGPVPDRWVRAVDAWDRLGCPWPAAYARWRQAEALLDQGGSRDQGAPLLRSSWRRPPGSGRGHSGPGSRRWPGGPGSGWSRRRPRTRWRHRPARSLA
jgi:hypothetical protein